MPVTGGSSLSAEMPEAKLPPLHPAPPCGAGLLASGPPQPRAITTAYLPFRDRSSPALAPHGRPGTRHPQGRTGATRALPRSKVVRSRRTLTPEACNHHLLRRPAQRHKVHKSHKGVVCSEGRTSTFIQSARGKKKERKPPGSLLIPQHQFQAI